MVQNETVFYKVSRAVNIVRRKMRVCASSRLLGEGIGPARSTLKPNVELIRAIQGLKRTHPGLRVHGFSNIYIPDFEKIRATVNHWAIFDGLTTSSGVGYRKPDFESYSKLQTSAKIEPHATIFVDDKSENVINAHCLGFHGILYDGADRLITQLHNLLGDPASRGMDYLNRHAKNLWCETSYGKIVKDNYSQLLILQCIGDRKVDTTALAMVTLEISDSQKENVLELILQNRSADGLPLMYLESMGPRLCPLISANILRFFFLNGQGCKLRSTLDYLCRVLRTNAFEIDSRYHCQADWIFYCLADLCAKCADPALGELRELLAERLQQRMGCDNDVLGAAMRVLAAQALENARDLATLLAAQQLDGGWPMGWL